MNDAPQGAPAYDAGALAHTAAARPKLVRGLEFEYEPFAYDGNTSGYQPFGKNVIIGIDRCPEKTSGGVLLTDQARETQDAGSITGAVVAIGAEAFRFFDDGAPWVGETITVGDRVTFEKYAGILVPGEDERQYRICDYRAIAARYVGKDG